MIEIKKRFTRWKEEEAKIKEEITRASSGFLQDEADYEVYKESWMIDFTIDDALDADDALDGDDAPDADADAADLDSVTYVCSVSLEENIDKAVKQCSEFLEGIKSKCKVLCRLWKYVQTQLFSLQGELRDDAIFITARNPDKEIVGIEFGKIIDDGKKRVSAQSLFTVVDPSYSGQKFGSSIVKLYEDAVRKKVAERISVGVEGKAVTAFVTVYDCNNFWSNQGYLCLPGEKISSKVLLAKKLPVKYEKSSSSSREFDPEALLSPY